MIIETIATVLSRVLGILGFFMALYWIPYLVRKGWGDAQNKTKKVCDVCFRDIELVNKVVSRLEDEGRLKNHRNDQDKTPNK